MQPSKPGKCITSARHCCHAPKISLRSSRGFRGWEPSGIIGASHIAPATMPSTMPAVSPPTGEVDEAQAVKSRLHHKTWSWFGKLGDQRVGWLASWMIGRSDNWQVGQFTHSKGVKNNSVLDKHVIRSAKFWKKYISKSCFPLSLMCYWCQPCSCVLEQEVDQSGCWKRFYVQGQCFDALKLLNLHNHCAEMKLGAIQKITWIKLMTLGIELLIVLMVRTKESQWAQNRTQYLNKLQTS